MDDTRERIRRGREAVRLARKKGMDTSFWEKEISSLEALAQAEDVARRTGELLSNQGWCLWKCSALDDDIIVVCRNDTEDGYPKGYPVYMENELEEICRSDITSGTLRLVHEAKKLSGARVVNEDRGG